MEGRCRSNRSKSDTQRPRTKDLAVGERKGHCGVVFDVEEVSVSQVRVALGDLGVDRCHVNPERAGDLATCAHGSSVARYGGEDSRDLNDPLDLGLEGDGGALGVEGPRIDEGNVVFTLHLRNLHVQFGTAERRDTERLNIDVSP